MGCGLKVGGKIRLCHDLCWSKTFSEVLFHTTENFSSVLFPFGCVGSKLFVVFFQGYGDLLDSTAVSSRWSFMIGETGFIPREEFIKRNVCLLIVERW